jgi:hypothetical protein
MSILTEKPTKDNPQSQVDTAPQEPIGCKLGRELTDCPLKRVGCGSLYDALLYISPPWSIREYVRATMGNDAAARTWLKHLDDVTPNVCPANGRGWWR